MTRFTPERISELRALVDAAKFNNPLKAFCEAPPPTLEIYDGTGMYPSGTDSVGWLNTNRGLTYKHVDLIVAAVNALPDALDEIEKLRGALELVDEFLESLKTRALYNGEDPYAIDDVVSAALVRPSNDPG